MGVLLVIVIVAVAGLVIATAIVFIGPERRPIALPPPPTASPGTPPDCDISGLPTADEDAGPVTLRRVGNLPDETIVGSTITLPRGVHLRLETDLTLIAAGDLVVDGILRAPDTAGSITLVSLGGTVRIGPGALIGAVRLNGTVNAVTARNADSLSNPGENGGPIRIIGVDIEILGTIAAQDGGGSFATATATGVRATIPGIGVRIPGGGRATAVSGQGGFGGDVLLCARRRIRVDGGLVLAGGGGGSFATAMAANGSLAIAQAGPGGGGGNVLIVGTAPAAPCRLFLPAGSIGGGAGERGAATAVGGNGQGVLAGGGPAVAIGGPGGAGGTVRFTNCVVAQSPGNISSGRGGRGGDATTDGGTGRDGRADGGYRGGDATSTGGRGGPAGAAPSIPQADGTPVRGASGVDGPGGTAIARPGAGGRPAFFGPAGDPGDGEATGGFNAAGTASGQLVSTPPSPAISRGAP